LRKFAKTKAKSFSIPMGTVFSLKKKRDLMNTKRLSRLGDLRYAHTRKWQIEMEEHLVEEVAAIGRKVDTTEEVGVTGDRGKKDLGMEEEETEGRFMRAKMWEVKDTTVLLPLGKSVIEAHRRKTLVLTFVVQVEDVVLEVMGTRTGEAAGGGGIVGEEEVVEEVSTEGRETKVLIEVALIGKPHLPKAYSGRLHLRRICNGRLLLLLLSRIFGGKLLRVQNLTRAILSRPIHLVATIYN